MTEYTGVTVDDLPLTITAGPVGPTEALQLDTLDTPARLGVVHALLAQIAASRRRT